MSPLHSFGVLSLCILVASAGCGEPPEAQDPWCGRGCDEPFDPEIPESDGPSLTGAGSWLDLAAPKGEPTTADTDVVDTEEPVDTDVIDTEPPVDTDVPVEEPVDTDVPVDPDDVADPDPEPAFPEDCGNSGDDDLDGAVDCDDPDCDLDVSCTLGLAFNSYTGWEQFEYEILDDDGDAVLEDTSIDTIMSHCLITWQVAGTPSVTPCTDCTFAFDLVMTYDESGSTDDGSYSVCPHLKTNFGYTYGYVEDLDGSGKDWLVYEYRGAMVPWTEATFNGTTFSYGEGYKDYFYEGDAEGYYAEYAGTWLTNFYEGQGTVF